MKRVSEFVVLNSKYVSHSPDSITAKEASVISGVGLTALRGIEDVLRLKKNESIMIFGASGGVEHMAVQFARYMDAKVFAIASGEDRVSVLRKLGVDALVDGRKDDVLAAVEGFDTAFFNAGGELANSLVQCVRAGGRIAYPNGIHPIPGIRPDISLIGYNGEPELEIIEKVK